MDKYNFYKRQEIKDAKQDRRNAEPSFSLTTDNLRKYLLMLLLDEDYIYIKQAL